MPNNISLEVKSVSVSMNHSSVNNCFFADHHNSPLVQTQVEGDKNGKRRIFFGNTKQLRQTCESVVQVINKTADWSGGEINISPDNIEVNF